MTAWGLVCLGLIATGATAVPDWYKAFEDKRVCTGSTPGSLCNDEIHAYHMKKSTPTEIQKLLAERDLPCCDERAGLYCTNFMEYKQKQQAGKDGMTLAGPYCQYSASQIKSGWYSYDLVTYTEPGNSVNGRPVWTDGTSTQVPYTSLLGADFAEKGGKVQVKKGGSLMATIPGDGMNNLKWNIADRSDPKLEDVLPYGEASLGIPTGHSASEVQYYTTNNAIDLYCDAPPNEFVSDGGHRGSGGGRSSDVGRATSGKMPTPTSDTWQVRPEQDRAGHLKEVLTYGVALAKALNKLPMTRSKQGLFSGGWRSMTEIGRFRDLAEKGEPLYIPSFMSSSLEEIHANEFMHYMYQPGYTASNPDGVDKAFVPVIFAIDSRHGKEVRFWNQWEREFIFMPNTPFRVQSVVECLNKPGTVDDPWLLQDQAQYQGYPLRGRPGAKGGYLPNNRPVKYFNVTLVDMDRDDTELDIFPVQGQCLADSEHRLQGSKSPHQGPAAAPLVAVGTEAAAAADPKILRHLVQLRPNNILSMDRSSPVMTCNEKMLTNEDGRYWKRGPCPAPFVVPCWHPNVAGEVLMLEAKDEDACNGVPGTSRYQLKWCDGAWPCHPKKTLHHNDGYNGGGIKSTALSLGRMSNPVFTCTETMLSSADMRSSKYSYGWKEGPCLKDWVVPCWHPNPTSSHLLELLKAEDEDACDGEPGSGVYQTKWCDGPWPCRAKPDRAKPDQSFFGKLFSKLEEDLAQLQVDIDGLD